MYLVEGVPVVEFMELVEDVPLVGFMELIEDVPLVDYVPCAGYICRVSVQLPSVQSYASTIVRT